MNELFVKIAELAYDRLGGPIAKMVPAGECWIEQIDKYKIMLNPNEASVTVDGLNVKPFTALVMFNGWPFAVLDAAGGAIGDGALANQAHFEAALDKARAVALDI